MNLNRKSREIARHISHLALVHGVECEFEMGGKHPKAVFYRDGKMRKFAFPGSPSDRRGYLNSLSDVRALFREMDWQKLPEATDQEPEKETAMSYNMIEHGRSADRNASQGPASEVKNIDPLLMSGVIPNLRGVRLPVIPDCAKITLGRGKSGGNVVRKPEYRTFVEARFNFIEQARAAGADWPDIAAALNRVGHPISRGGVYQAYTKGLERRNGVQKKKAQSKYQVDKAYAEHIANFPRYLDKPAYLGANVDDIFSAIVSLLGDLVKAARASDAAKDAELALLRKKVEAFKVAMDLANE